jgi:ATP-binding cassette subfamily C (CFTR/MRP) protein 1
LVQRLTNTVLRLPYVDHVIVLGADGRIAQQGSFDELNMREGYITGLLLPKPDWRYMTEEEETKSEETASSSSLNGIVAATEATEEKDSKMIEANRSTGDLTVYKFYIDSIGALYLTVFLFFICAFVFSTSFPGKTCRCCP